MMRPMARHRPTLPAIAVIAALAAALTGPAMASNPASEPPALIPLTKTWSAESEGEEPSSRWSYGAALRTRAVDIQNAMDLGLGFQESAEFQFVRIRSRIWFDYRFSPETKVFVRINNESWKYLQCKACDSRFDEIIFENLYLEAARLFGLPLKLRIGRQDLFYGDGFVVCDGTPLDGSRTAYVNGLLISSRVPLWSFDTFIVRNQERDGYLPRINNKYRQLLEFDEIVGGLFIRRLNRDNTPTRYTFEPYYLYKEEKGVHKQAQIHTFGTRLVVPVWTGSAVAEFAYQGGRTAESRLIEIIPELADDLAAGQSVSAYGGHARVDAEVASPVPAKLTAGYMFLSGNDPVTRNKYEGWNPVLGRWPLWSELYIYTTLLETFLQPMDQGIANWQNMKAPFVGVTLRPSEDFGIEARHLWLSAVESLPVDRVARTRVRSWPKQRGGLLALKLTWQIDIGLAGHILYERLSPGAFYTDNAKNASFLRFEVSIAK
jgi:hypothetical protein